MSSSLTLVMLAVFSGLAMNLILQFGIALKGLSFDEPVRGKNLLAGLGVLFFSVLVLWLIFFFIRSVLFLGFLEYVLLFPVSCLVFSCFEYLANRFLFKKKKSAPSFDNSLCGGTFSGGILAASALFIMLNVAGGLLEAVVLSLSFSCSAALVFVIVSEIRRRSGMEPVPHCLRGGPLALIAMGLLSLVFSSGALMLFGVLGVE